MTEPLPSIAPGLYIVATPIGNLEDITLRALRVLGSVDRIACEDTRQSQKLLRHFGIATPMVSYHQHNERQRSTELITLLQQGARIALISDAGMPGISDPGAEIVQQAIAAGIPVIPIPGACAAVTALAATGIDTSSFLFLGFPPSRSGERRNYFEALRRQSSTMVFYEAPHRIVATLADAVAAFGAERNATLARELTKIHEEFLRGTLQEMHATLSSRETVRGEITLVIAGAGNQQGTHPADTTPTSILARLAELKQQENLDEMDALKRIARERGISKSEAYRELQRERSKTT
ncbi:MAG TPA: 16S rRNA (cytidine(1402)-2'-O)-methyltransferase [Acidobacteriaceae bacterium]|jgi:16S rRNA (cytidine1402-2'-O)-methyltransferase|nr:16S rRNA (cytidine(1402)-2'-O)-methyltransferase [Acidobacteriaceae bacterium]